MENNQTDFMKNRPVADKANQYKDVYGSQSKSTRTTITVLLLILMTVLVIVAWIYGNYLWMGFFSPVLVGLIISLFIGRRADKYNTPVKPEDSPEAIFKEHDI
ncbi:MAG: hypothetical protein IJ639_03020 [Ruminococcus sp.]|nr:hypothetical protein [Ruminococcus sp.]